MAIVRSRSIERTQTRLTRPSKLLMTVTPENRERELADKHLQSSNCPPSEVRKANMRAVRSKDTSPELRVRRFLHKRGFRFRLNKQTLPGTPDIVLKRYRTVVFVHGCFWHRHPGCSRSTTPKTRTDFWTKKVQDERATRQPEGDRA